MFFAHAISFWTLALWLASTGCSGQIKDSIYNITEEEWLIFGNMTTFITNTSSVFHMEADRLLPGNIIFADRNSLKTTDGTTTITLASSDDAEGYRNGPSLEAMFMLIFGFIQRPNTHQVFIADYGNHCLRRLDRQTELVTDLAGTCTSSGYADGNAAFAKFNAPIHLLSDPQNSSIIIITEANNDGIRSLNLDTMVVSTIAKSSKLGVKTITLWENNSNISLLVASQNQISGISRITLKDELSSRVSGGDRGFVDGWLGIARYNYISDMIFVRNNLYIATDVYHHRLRIVDLLNSRVTSICTGEYGHTDGPVSSCNIGSPHSLLLLNSTLYIGASRAIRQLPVSVQHQETARLQVNSGTELFPTTLEENSTGTPSTLPSLTDDTRQLTATNNSSGFTVPVTTELVVAPWVVTVSVISSVTIMSAAIGIAVFCKKKIWKGNCCCLREIPVDSSTFHQQQSERDYAAQQEEAIYNCIYESNYITIEDCGLSVMELHPLNPSNLSHSVQPNVEPRPDVTVPLRQISRDPYNPYSYASVPSPHRNLPPLPESEQSDNGYIDTDTLDMHYTLNTIDKSKATDENTGESLELQISQEDAGGRIETRKSLEEEPTIPAKPGYARVEEELTISAKPGCVGAVEIASTLSDSEPTNIHDD